MRSRLKVLSAGIHSTVQDLGRVHHQRVGVPVSGALDPIGLRLANALVGNDQAAAAVEICFGGFDVELRGKGARIALGGGPCMARIEGRSSRDLPAWQSALIFDGEILRVGAIKDASCAYLAVAGGFSLAAVLGSRSTYTHAQLGGYQGRRLAAGDEIPLERETPPDSFDQALPQAPDYGAGPVRLVLGPQDDHFTRAAIDALFGEEYRVSTEANRIGVRLEGPRLAHQRSFDIPSDGTVTGNIQVPGSGQPIILLPDHQTTGGYTKIATVITADLPRVGRLIPGASVRFAAVGPDEAVHLARKREAHVVDLVRRMERVRGNAVLDLDRLAHSNLISGVVNAQE